ncbi:MAG: hypothetical protein Cons2KO_07210 [Congregibacter sp.]
MPVGVNLFKSRLSTLVTLVLLTALAAGTFVGWQYQREPLLVMLQTRDLPKTLATVRRIGGTVSHELPIIDAIGAELSRGQLWRIKRASPELIRVIDDLAWDADEELITAPDQCPLSSSIELEWSGARAFWRIYNKGQTEIVLSTIEVSIDPELGELAALSINGVVQDAELTGGNEHSLSTWKLRQPYPVEPASIAVLELQLPAAPANPWQAQNSISITAKADESCGTKLVASYEDPLGDSYYPTLTGAASLHRKGITGDGITIAVLDSGLWEAHEELALNTRGEPRILARYDAIRGQAVGEAFDESGHGTHMTSVMARSGKTNKNHPDGASYRGIAPDAQIVAIKAFGESGEAGFLDIVRGIQWVVDNKDTYGIQILNLSFAARPRWPYWEDPVNQALMRAWKAGLFIAAAAGNEGPEAMTVGSPGNLPYLLTVGAITDSWTPDDRNDDYIPDFSSRGPTPMGHIKPDVVAPGGHMAGIARPGSTLMRELPEYLHSSGDFVMTGSSQATAAVSGLAALMQQLIPSLSNDELKCMLMSSAMPAIELSGKLAYSPFAQGSGLVDVGRAILFGEKSCEQDEFDLSKDLAGPDHYQGPAVFDANESPALPGQDSMIELRERPEGPSETLRWGAGAHLQRLQAAPQDPPFDWERVYQRELTQLQQLTAPTPEH